MINSLDTLVKVFECALGTEQGEVAFTVGLDTVNRIATNEDNEIQIVHIERLDEIVGDAHPIMMKIDVEGNEEGVLQGARKLLANSCLKVVELETVTSETAYILNSNHFEKAHYDPFSRSLNRNPIGPKSANDLFVRDWKFVSERLATARKVMIHDHEI